MGKKILIALLIILVAIQLIRPKRNVSSSPGPEDIRVNYAIPANVEQILKRSCFDCHSNNTHYPWYAGIQPVGLWLQHHINEGKEHLNFSIFDSYTQKKKAHKMEEVAENVESGEMPLKNYTLVHTDAKLSKEDAALLMDWARQLQQQLQK